MKKVPNDSAGIVLVDSQNHAEKEKDLIAYRKKQVATINKSSKPVEEESNDGKESGDLVHNINEAFAAAEKSIE